jgi:predicted deacylase
LHTAAIHRINLPQIRANLHDPETYSFAKAFGSPIMIHANTRDGSLRQAVSNLGIPILLYEGGEALRFDPLAVNVGVEGILRVMNSLEMYPIFSSLVCHIPQEVFQLKWMRAPRGGIFLRRVELGETVTKKQVVGIVTDAFGDTNIEVKANLEGIVIGYTQNPLVNQGDAIVNLGIK